MRTIIYLQWWFKDRWNDIGWPATEDTQSAHDLWEHGRRLAAHGGRYRIVSPDLYGGVEVIHNFPEIATPQEEPMDIPDDVFDEMARDTTAPKRVPCAACGTWTCLECGYVRLHANRYSSKPQTCSDCGSAEGIMEPAGHQKDKRILNHAAKVRRMTSEGVSPRYPLEGFDYGYAKDACVTEGASSPDVPTRRWLVEARPPFHRTDGPFEDVGAAFFGIEDGCLIFRDNRGEIIYARAAGTWLTCVPEEN